MKHDNERKAPRRPILWTTSGGYGVLWSRIDDTMSGYRRVLIFYRADTCHFTRTRTITSTPVEAFVAYGNTGSEIGRIKVGSP